ncbi:hypothetical protein BDV97DRAFT_361601 [Delphinella strobiligena]|nr:hypothetical protein BDV97DRAFT_361601 [Delphinella strobiligena]
MWSLQSWIWGNKEWFSGYGLSARQKKVLIQPWVDNDEEELKQSEEKAAFSVLKEKQTQAPMAKLPGLPKKPLRSIPIFWANDNAAEEIHAWYANTKMNQDVIANMTWESFRDKIRRCFPLQDRSQNIDKIYLQQHVSTGSSSTIATETELQPDLWTEQRITLSDQDPYTTNLLFTSKQVSSTELRDAFWETWSDVVEIWAAAITEERELELEGIDDPEERQKRMQPREGKAELEARLEKYRARHPDSKVGLEGGGNPRGKRMWAMAVDETAIDEKMANAKRKKV